MNDEEQLLLFSAVFMASAITELMAAMFGWGFLIWAAIRVWRQR